MLFRSDDVSAQTRFARQYTFMEAQSGLVLCGCRVEYFPREQVRGGALWYEAWINSTSTPDEVAREIFVECPIAHPRSEERRVGKEWRSRGSPYQ